MCFVFCFCWVQCLQTQEFSENPQHLNISWFWWGSQTAPNPCMRVYEHTAAYLPHANSCLVNLLIYFHVLFCQGHIFTSTQYVGTDAWAAAPGAAGWIKPVWTLNHNPQSTWTNIATFTVGFFSHVSHFKENFYVQFFLKEQKPTTSATKLDWQVPGLQEALALFALLPVPPSEVKCSHFTVIVSSVFGRLQTWQQ